MYGALTIKNKFGRGYRIPRKEEWAFHDCLNTHVLVACPGQQQQRPKSYGGMSREKAGIDHSNYTYALPHVITAWTPDAFKAEDFCSSTACPGYNENGSTRSKNVNPN